MTWEILQGDCIERMAEMEEASVDAIVTDPPYGLSAEPDIAEVLTHWLAGDDYKHRGGGFMGNSWDSFVPGPAYWTAAFRLLKPGGHLLAFAGSRTVDLMGIAIRMGGFEIRDSIMWLYGSGFPKSLDVSKAIDKRRDDEAAVREVCRFLRRSIENSEHTIASIAEGFGFHPRMVDHWAARDTDSQPTLPTLEQWDALRDLLGFDDSMNAEVLRLNLRKGEPGEAWADRPITGKVEEWKERSNYALTSADGKRRDVPASAAAKQWEGWGTALKPAHEPIVVARKPFPSTVAANILEHGTGGINVGATKIAHRTVNGGNLADNPHLRESIKNSGSTFGADGDLQQDPDGRWPANVVLSHAEDCVPVGNKKVKVIGATAHQKHHGKGKILNPGEGQAEHAGFRDEDGTETVEAWECAPGCPVAELDRQSGRLQSGRRAAGVRSGMGYHGAGGDGGPAIAGDSGGASRFFYCAKTSRAERNAGLEGFEKHQPRTAMEGGERVTEGRTAAPGHPEPAANVHPTVKPLNLMRWLLRLVTPPGGTCLDPFLGSGSTGAAAVLEGLDFIGIEREDGSERPDGTKRKEYAQLAEARIKFWSQHIGQEVEDVLGLHSASQKQAKTHADLGQEVLDLETAQLPEGVA